MSTPINHLSEISACDSAVAWVKSTKCRSLESAWKKCERGDWMLWYAGKKAGPEGDEKRKKLVLAACACARLALPIWEKRYPDDKRVRDCIETAEKWARNEATLEALQVSRRNCYAAAAAAADASAYAADAAASAAAHCEQAVSSALSAQSAELEALRATVAKMREALQSICDIDEVHQSPTISSIRRGREALSLVPSDLADCVVVKRSEWEAALDALEPLAALADAYDAELRSRGIIIPRVHDGDDSSVAFPEEQIIRFLRKREQPHYVTMRDAVRARTALRGREEII